MTPKSDFLQIRARTITHKGFVNAANFGEATLFLKLDYEQQTSTRLRSIRANK